MEIQLKAGIVICVTSREGEDIGVNGFIRKLDVKVIRELLAIESESLVKHDIYSIMSEKDILKVNCKEHSEFEVDKELLRKLYDHITELQGDIDRLCNSKSFTCTYQYSVVNKDKSFDPENDEKQRNVNNIKNENASSFIGRTAMDGDKYEEPKNEKLHNIISSVQNILPVPATSTISNISSLDQFNYLTPVNINQTVTTTTANDSGFVGMSGDEYNNFTIPPMLYQEPKNEKVQNISNIQNILPSPNLPTSFVSNISSLDQVNKKPSTPFTVAMEGNLPSPSANFEDEFFSTPSKAKCNYKGLLQEMLAKSPLEVELPNYSGEKEGSGFTASVEVTISGEVSSYGSPVRLKSKKDAEQAAAEKAYNALKESNIGVVGDSEQEDSKRLFDLRKSSNLPDLKYDTISCYGPNINNFKTFITINGNVIEGPVERNKKLAKKKAESIAWKEISTQSTS